MSDIDLIDAVAHVTGEDAHEIRRRGFMLTGPEGHGGLGRARLRLPRAVLHEHAEGPEEAQGQREEAGGPSGMTRC